MNIFERAKLIAKAAHEEIGQTYDGEPYFDKHVMDVLAIAEQYIYIIPVEYRMLVLAGIACHDVLEDTNMTFNDLGAEFKKHLSTQGGEDVDEYSYYDVKYVQEYAFALSTSTGRNRRERADKKYYKKIQNMLYAPYGKSCDRLANAKASTSKGHGMSKTYLSEYFGFRKKVYTQCEFFYMAPLMVALDQYLLEDKDELLMGRMVISDLQLYVVTSLKVVQVKTEGYPRLSSFKCMVTIREYLNGDVNYSGLPLTVDAENVSLVYDI